MDYLTSWRVHGDGRRVVPGAVVAPEERLSWPRTIGIGAQHVLAMFGATFLVPLLTGFPAATTLFFSGVGTLLFLLITGNRLPSYLGSSFAFIAPVQAAVVAKGRPEALGGIVLAGLLFLLVGIGVHLAGTRWIEALMPPVVTGTIVALIGLSLAPTAWEKFRTQPYTALLTLIAIVVCMVLFRGLIGRLSILLGVLVGYAIAVAQGQVHFGAVGRAAWVGLPAFTAPRFDLGILLLFVPVVLVLIAENLGHVKAVASMTGRRLDDVMGRAFIGDGAATVLAGAGGGSGTTTYAENIGVMAATRVYSTAAYWVAGAVALLLGLSPKFGELIATVPSGVLGGAAVALYGLIGVLGARIWVESHVDFRNSANLMTAAIGLVIGIANFGWTPKVGGRELVFNGIAIGTAATVLTYHLMREIGSRTGTVVVGPHAPPDPIVTPDTPAPTRVGAPRGEATPRRPIAQRPPRKRRR
jgi:uracil-xanthine permease